MVYYTMSSKIQKVVSNISTKAFHCHNGHLYISYNILMLFPEYKFELMQLKTKLIDGRMYSSIDSIERCIRKELGLYKHNSNLIINFRNTLITTEQEVKAALNDANNLRVNFIDHFNDEQTVMRKSNTLAILMIVKNRIDDKEYMLQLYQCLIDLQVTCDLLFPTFKEFYKKVKESKRFGLVGACLSIL